MRAFPCCCLQGILSGLKQVDDEAAQLASLSDLCELLSISTEESLTTFPVEQIVPMLVCAQPQLWVGLHVRLTCIGNRPTHMTACSAAADTVFCGRPCCAVLLLLPPPLHTLAPLRL